MPDKIKVSVNLTEADLAALRALAEGRGTTVTEALRRAIATEKFVNEVTSQGGKIVIENPDKTQREVLIR